MSLIADGKGKVEMQVKSAGEERKKREEDGHGGFYASPARLHLASFGRTANQEGTSGESVSLNGEERWQRQHSSRRCGPRFSFRAKAGLVDGMKIKARR